MGLSNIVSNIAKDNRSKISNAVNTLSAFQKNQQVITPDEQKPVTARTVYAQIQGIAKKDPTRAQDLFNQFTDLQNDPTSPFYNPYLKPTNKGLESLSAYGVDTSVIDDDFFSKWDPVFLPYLKSTGTTNAPSAPGKKASAIEKAAYDYWQVRKEDEATKKVEQQWAALQEELTRTAQLKGRNYSDDEIIANIDWSKYKDLHNMFDSDTLVNLPEYNRPIGFSEDAMYGTLWMARNPDYKGGMAGAMANSYLGNDNVWTPDPVLQEKLDNSLYSVGSTMEDMQIYYGRDAFDQKWLDDNRWMLNSVDKTMRNNYIRVNEAYKKTVDMQEQADAFQKKLDTKLAIAQSPEDVMKDVDRWLNSSNFNLLAKMDETLTDGYGFIDTTDAVNYSRYDTEKYVRDYFAKKEEQKNGAETLSGLKTAAPGGGVSDDTVPQSVAGDELTEKTINRRVTSVESKLYDSMSDTEKRFLSASPLMYGQQLSDSFYKAKQGTLVQGPANPALSDPAWVTQMAAKLAESAEKSYAATNLSSLQFRTEYEKKRDERDALQDQLNIIESQYGEQMLATQSIPEEATVKFDPTAGFDLYFEMDDNGKYVPEIYLEHPSVVAYMKAHNLTEEDFAKMVQGYADQLTERADNIRKAQDKYQDVDLNAIEGMPKEQEINSIKGNLSKLDRDLAAGLDEYNAKVQEVRMANDRRYRIGDITLRNSGMAIDPAVSDDALSYVASFTDWENPASGYDGVIEELDQKYGSIEALKDENRKELNSYISYFEEESKTARFMADYFEDTPAEYKAKMNEYADWMDSQNRLYKAFLLKHEKNFDALAEEGREMAIHDMEANSVLGEKPTDGSASKAGFLLLFDDEKDIYYALYALNGKEAADQFYADMEGSLLQRAQTNISESTKEAAQSGVPGRLLNVGYSIASATIEPVLNLMYLGTAVAGKENKWLRIPSYSAQEATNAVTSELKEKYKGTVWGTILPKFAQMVVDRGRSWAAGGMYSGMIPEKAGDAVHAIPISLVAGGEAYENAIDNGLKPWQAGALALVNFACEDAFEAIKYGNYKSAFPDGAYNLKSYKAFFLDKIKGLDWLEEGTGETATNIVERIFNDWIAGDKSERNKAIQAYIDAGVVDNVADAELLVMGDFFREDLETFVTSSLSTFLDVLPFTAGKATSALHYARQASRINKATGANVTARALMNRDIQAIKDAQDLKQKEQNGDLKSILGVGAKGQSGPEYVSESRRGENDTEYDVDITILDNSFDSDRTTQTSTIGAVLRVNDTNSRQANAAAIAFANENGEDSIAVLEDMLQGGQRAGINIGTLKMGIQYAALANGWCRQVMSSAEFRAADGRGKAEMLAAAVMADATSDSVRQEVNNAVHEYRVNVAEQELMSADGVEEKLEAAQKDADEAARKSKEAESELQNKQAEFENAQGAVAAAREEVKNDPGVGENAMKKATSDVVGAAAVVAEHQQSVADAESRKQETAEKAERTKQDTMAEIRQRAEEKVAQEEQQAKIDAEIREKAAAVARENNNFARLDAEQFVQQNFPNLSKEDQEYAIMRVMGIQQALSNTSDAILARGKFAEAFANKFGLQAKTVQNVFFNARINPKDGTLLISDNATQSDIMYAVLIHEITHLAENDTTYNELADTVLQDKYGKDVSFAGILKQMESGDISSQLAQDILSRKALYDETLSKQEGKKVELTYKEALQEIVADRVGYFIASDQAALDKLVAEKPNLARRILNSIKSFLRKAVGLEDGTISQAQRVVDMLEAALNTENQNEQATAVARPAETVQDLGWEIKQDYSGFYEDYSLEDYVYADGKRIGQIIWGGNAIRLDKDSVQYGEQLENAGYTTTDGRTWEPGTEAQESRYSMPIARDEDGNALATELPGDTVALDTENFRYSLNSFNQSEQNRVRQALYNKKNADGSNTFTKAEVDHYLDDALSLASMIAADRARLDFIASDNQVFLKPNNDYHFTLDASTLCAKRLLYQGTFDYVQHALPDEVFTPTDLIDLVNIMSEMGYETPCGICYVESRRRWLDTYANEFIENVQKNENGFIDEFVAKRFKKSSEEEKAALRERLAGELPSIDDLTTSDGLERLRKNDPLMYKAFVAAMNAKGSQNPKVVQLRTEYRGDIGKLSKKDIQKVKDIGGLRIQSFSDFETPHLLDMVQAVLDMSSVGLTSQAYTKVPNFAWVFGDTGIKINLSLIGKGTGLDADGNLVFDNVEGMNFDEAMKLRNRYSKNVGTILVGINDNHIIAAMGDPRIDFIIPFHKSGWSDKELKGIPSLNNYLDYTSSQNELMIVGDRKHQIKEVKDLGEKALDTWIVKEGENHPGYKVIDQGNGKYTVTYDIGYETESFDSHKKRTGNSFSNFEPVGAHAYWDFSKSGEENARTYLKMCADSGRIPKFSQFLVDNGDGSFSLPEGNDKRSTAIRTGYWKTLIDFKMYDNDGKGAAQTAVTPNINMSEAYRVLDEHKLGRQMPDRDGKKGAFLPVESNNDVPVAIPAAEEYIARIRRKREGSKPVNPDDTLKATPSIDVGSLGASPFREIEANNTGANARIAAAGALYEQMESPDSTESTEAEAAKQNAMAVDPETGETVRYRYSLPVTDQNTLNFLNEQEKNGDVIKTYRTMKLLDGKLVSPKATLIKGKVEGDTQLGQWEAAAEHPELLKFNEKGEAYFDLKEKGDKVTQARYNPYMHSSNLMLNDQFAAAYQYSGENKKLGQFVTVECIVPKSEAESGYWAQYAKDPVGWTNWKAGGVAGEIANQGGPSRQVFLSRWIKPVRIVPDSEVAQHYKQLLEGKDIEVPANVVTPSLLSELEKAGVRIGAPQKQQASKYRKQMGERYSLPAAKPSDAPYMNAVDRGDMDTAQRMVDERATENGYDVQYAVWRGDSQPYTVLEPGENGGNLGTGLYFTPDRPYAERFATKNSPVRKFYLKTNNTFDYDEFTQEFNNYAMSWLEENEMDPSMSIDEYTWSAIWDDFINENDYDSVEATGVGGRAYGASEIAVQNSWQAKLADPVTYDDNGNVIPLSERFNDQEEDVRYSLPSDDILDQRIQQYFARNSIPEGTDLSTNTEPGPQRQFGSRTAQESAALHDEVKDYLFNHSSYTPDSNQAQIDRAMDWIRGMANDADPDGYRAALDEVTSANFDYRSADGQARMLAVMGMAALKARDGDPNALQDELRLADAYNQQGTDLGRQLQARKIFRLMTPVGRQSVLQKMVRDINDGYEREGNNTRVALSEWVLRAAGAADTEEDFQKVQQAAANELAAQMPANWKDRFRGWRMLSMLGNPRTHIRNIIGNLMFVPAVGLKNKMAAALELTQEKGNRTKTLAPILSSEIRNFAREDANAMRGMLTGEAKYNESDLVEKARKPFKGLLQAMIDFNSNKLEQEDWLFLKGHYRRALGGWIQGNGYTVEQMQNNPELLQRARAYAISEAQKATYRDFNQLAATLNQVSRGGGAAGFLVDATLPFKKTPANILKRGLEYSPVGLMKSLTADLYHLKQYNDAKAGKLSGMPETAISPNQFIDHMCSGLTGSAILAVGYLLSSAGIVSCGLDDDDDALEKEKGNQKYAIKFSIAGHDYTYTMDWAAPMSMPFFVGAAIQEQFANQGDVNVEEIINAFGNITEPVFNLSMLDGVNTLFKTSQYDDTNTLTQIGAKVASNYVTSYVPSVLGAITRTFFDDTQRKAYVKSGEGTGVMGTARYAREQVENKIPGLSQTNIPYRNIWGEEKTSSFAERIIENFISPGYIEEYRNDPLLNEMGRLFDATGDSKLVPSDPPKSFTYKNDKYTLEAEDWDTYKETRGRTAFNLLTQLVGSEAYQSASTDLQAQMMKDVWSYADKVGRKAIIPDYEIENYGDNPANGIMKESKTSNYQNEMIKALEATDYQTYQTMREALLELDVADSSIKTKIGNTYRDRYKEAYLKNDRPTMVEISTRLDETGYDFDIAKWESDADEKRK